MSLSLPFSRICAAISHALPGLAWVALLSVAAGVADARTTGAPWERIEPARELLDGVHPRTGAVRLDLPSVTQDGSSVAFTLSVDHPMRPDDYIESVFVFAAGNPAPEVAEFHFTPMAGKAEISTRIRLDRSQTVFALARTSSGEWLAGSRDVRVTVSGCVTRSDGVEGPDFMRPRVRAPARIRSGEPVDVRTLINHPMETGLREGPDGKAIPKRLVSEFRAEMGGEAVLTARFHRAIAENPYLLFFVAPGHAGELNLTWEEDTGKAATAATEIPSV